MFILIIILLAVIQGLAELLPVSSSAHVIAVERLLGIDPSEPKYVLLLVMLHTGTMFAVIVYFWRAWMRTFFSSQEQFIRFATKIIIATAMTGGIGYALMKGIERVQDPGYTQFVSWSISDTDPTKPAPTGKTLLTNLVLSDTPATRLFHADESLTINVKKDGGLPTYETINVTAKSTLDDLCQAFVRGFHVDPAGAGNRAKPGVEIIPDTQKHRNAIQIQVTGNKGHALKLSEGGFIDTNGDVRIGFLDETKGAVEHLFKRLDLVAAALAAAGVIILLAGTGIVSSRADRKGITTADGVWLGLIQAMTVPFRGLSRSGVTISAALIRGINRTRAEEFSFAMAVALTPPVILYEGYKLYDHLKQTTPLGMGLHDLAPGAVGLVFSFLAGLVALKLLSRLLEKGQWWIFGIYCFAAAAAVYAIHVHLSDHPAQPKGSAVVLAS